MTKKEKKEKEESQSKLKRETKGHTYNLDIGGTRARATIAGSFCSMAQMPNPITVAALLASTMVMRSGSVSTNLSRHGCR